MRTVITRKRSPNLRKTITKVSNRKAHCIACNRQLTGKQTKFCSSNCKSKSQSNVIYANQQKRGNKRKNELIKLLGGHCQNCSYNKSARALCFHHINPSTKKFSLDIRHLSNRSMEQIVKEVQKCQLLCANCHMELHDAIESPALTN